MSCKNSILADLKYDLSRKVFLSEYLPNNGVSDTDTYQLGMLNPNYFDQILSRRLIIFTKNCVYKKPSLIIKQSPVFHKHFKIYTTSQCIKLREYFLLSQVLNSDVMEVKTSTSFP